MTSVRLLPAALVCLAGTVAAAGPAHWGYSAEAGPERWGSLSPEFATCAAGKNQSPIDVADALEAQLPALTIRYQPGGDEIVNNGHSVQVNYAPGSVLTVGGRSFELKQFHFHSPSENHVQGKSFALEAHLVHADREGNSAVVAVLFERGEENPALGSFWSRMPVKAGARAALPQPVAADSLLPSDRDYYRFSGSLTTPPCSEGVLWLVMKAPGNVSHAQVAAFTKALGGIANNRPLQPLNARAVLK